MAPAPAALKRAGSGADPGGVASGELSCPVCMADIPVAGDEPAGSEVFCTYCQAPCRLTKAASEEDCELEEDF